MYLQDVPSSIIYKQFDGKWIKSNGDWKFIHHELIFA